MNVNKDWKQLVMVPERYVDFPPQMLHDMLSAIRSFDHINDKLYLEDFDWKFMGPKTIESLVEYDKGMNSWLKLSTKSTINDLKEFRGYQWMCKALKWAELGVPPVIAIQYRNQCQIGDGRGRINFANMMGYDVPLYFMKYKNENNN